MLGMMGKRPCNRLDNMTQPPKATEYGTNPCTRNENGTMGELDRLIGWDNESSQFTAANEMEWGRKSRAFLD
jgi:hypothetical protein